MQTETAESANVDVKALCAAAPPCLTITMPVFTSPDQARQNPVRLRQLLQQAMQHLREYGVDAATAQTMVDGIKLVPDSPNGELGLLIFRNATDVMWHTYVPSELQESIHVGEHFFLKALLPQLEGERHFYILALSQKHIRLLRCTNHSSEEVPLPPSIPKNLEEYTQLDKPDHLLENRSAAGQGSKKGVLFGTSSDVDGKGEYLRHFYKAVDHGILELLKHDPAPVVIAGVEYELPMYRDVSALPNLVAEGVKGSPDGLKGGEMHKRALAAVEPHFAIAVTNALEMYEKFVGLKKATANLKDIVQAAHDGRVMHLFVADDAERMGSFREVTQTVKVHSEKQSGDEDLVNLAVVQTLLHSGGIHQLSRNKMPNGVPIAAVLRY